MTVPVSHQRLAQTFAELADTLVKRFDSIEFLHVLAERSVELLPVDAAGIQLADDRGVLSLMAASSRTARPDRHSLPQGENSPAEECIHSGRTVHCPDLRTPPPSWAPFTAAAVALGFTAVDAVPMRLQDKVIGALTLFRTLPGALSAETSALAQSFANVATIGVLHVRSPEQDEAVATALTSHGVIEQAKGVLTERLEVGVADAFSLMRNYARNTGQLLSDVARQVIERAPEADGLTRAGTPRRR